METLVRRIRQEGRSLGQGILKVDGFINHRLEPALTLEMGRAFAARFGALGVTDVSKVVTAEVSGIAPALATGVALGVPVVYARKKRPVTMPDALISYAPSRTKGGVTPLYLSPEYVGADDRVLLIDDFLASGQTILALAELIGRCGAALLGVGCAVEKTFEPGRETLSGLGVPVVSLAAVTALSGAGVRVENGR
ncbi:MAG: Xanthine phosphoribosyltransferase [uncultured Truepera sp.]|uniref:Xanthine phosphoribosyltransferase n=1 Tax=uncultured Truepera sp. TaxID=543023 RepID=A0A6J4VV19_9DEIN|nr:MAG: Xanthine phosphoribosyltransferase [uncultured Truepera sp.]